MVPMQLGSKHLIRKIQMSFNWKTHRREKEGQGFVPNGEREDPLNADPRK